MFIQCLYTAPLSTIISSYRLSHHLYADDTHIYISLPVAQLLSH